MKRRDFLKGLSALPLASALAPAIAALEPAIAAELGKTMAWSIKTPGSHCYWFRRLGNDVSLGRVWAYRKDGSVWNFVGFGPCETTFGDLPLFEPETTQDGDLLIAFVASRGSSEFTPPAGWTLIPSGSAG